MQTVVNTVNCVGVMGKGIALVYKLRYPKLFDAYKEKCNQKEIKTGSLWLYTEQTNAPWILNFPTKFHWKYPSKMEYVERGLQCFVEDYEKLGITSIAFPMLGAYNGGLDPDQVLEKMESYLSQCDIPIEIYEYDPTASDDLYETFASKWKSFDLAQIARETGMRKDRIKKVQETIDSGDVRSMMGLINMKGIGLVTMEQCFAFVMHTPKQPNLFD